jgi:hypothetical protein
LAKRRHWIRLALPDERRFQFADTATYSSGSHTVKFGVDINRVRDIDDNLFTGGGSTPIPKSTTSSSTMRISHPLEL